jgi:type IV pilus assembly protein PilE
MQFSHRPRGFTLIELMITVAVVAILAAIAYPSYQEHVRKSRRAAAQGVLMDVASRQQQIFVDSRAYAADLAGTGASVPVNVQAVYAVSVAASAATPTQPPAFVAMATPTGGQAEDRCGTLTINQAGVKTPAGCW